jgi:hypothetical protein
MNDEEIRAYLADNLGAFWSGLSDIQKGIWVELFGLGFEVGMNQAEYEVKVGGCFS